MLNKKLKRTQRGMKIQAVLAGVILLSGLFMLLPQRSAAQAFYRGVHMAQLSNGFGGRYQVYEERLDTMGGANNIIGEKRKVEASKWGKGSNAWGVHYEYGYKEWRKRGSIGIGGYVGMRRIRTRTPGIMAEFQEREYRYWIFAFETKYHMYTRNRWDPYLNANIGVQVLRFRYIFTNNVPGKNPDFDFVPTKRLRFAGQVSIGTRYFFANNLALFLEGGFGHYYLKGGLNVIIVP